MEIWGLGSTSYLDSLLGACKKRCAFLHHNLISVGWLYRKWMQVWFSNTRRVAADEQTEAESEAAGQYWTWRPLEPLPTQQVTATPEKACAWVEERLSPGRSSLREAEELPRLRPRMRSDPVSFKIRFLGRLG